MFSNILSLVPLLLDETGKFLLAKCSAKEALQNMICEKAIMYLSFSIVYP
jgi:hypothetical protein